MKDIELIREAADWLETDMIEKKMAIAKELRALADRMEKAEPVGYFIKDVCGHYEHAVDPIVDSYWYKQQNLPTRELVKLYEHPASDEVEELRCEVEKWKTLASQINTDWIPANQKLSDEVERLKAENEAMRKVGLAYMEVLKAAAELNSENNARLSAIKAVVDGDDGNIATLAKIEAILNTSNQQEGK